MTHILITGGTGVLGRQLTPLLQSSGMTVRITSRRARPETAQADLEWAQVDLESGEGLDPAMQDVDAVIHAASSALPFTRVDVAGTEHILRGMERAGIEHIVYPSIVGIHKIPFSYYRNKLEAERLIEASGLPHTILRATQFHSLLDFFIGQAARLPWLFLPTDFQFQLVAAREVAEEMVRLVAAGPAGRAADFGGPEVRQLGSLAESWLRARGIRRRIVRTPLVGATAAAFRRGENTAPDRATGVITWEAWLGMEGANSGGG